MSDIIEYIDNRTALYCVEFENFESYFLLLDSSSAWSNKLAEFLLNLQKMKITKSKDSKNPFYFSCNTFNENLNLNIEISEKDLINKMCEVHFNEKTFLIQDKNNKFFINFNLESIINNPEYTIIGILLNPLEGLIKYLEENQNNLILKKVEKYNDIIISSIVINDENNNENVEKQNNQEYQNQENQEDLEEEEIEESLDDENKLDIEDEEINANKKRKKNRKSSLEGELLEEKQIRRGRKKDQIDENKGRDEVTKFIAKLREAIELDKRNMIRNQPAFEKLKLVNVIQKFLSNYFYQKIFLEYNGLELLQDWIKKNKDGSYPVYNQITTILDVLASLSISVTNLRNCIIGSYVMDLKQIKDSKVIQKKAHEIIEKWSRIVWDINTDYSDIDLENKFYKSVFSSKKRNRENNFLDENNEKDEDEQDKNEEGQEKIKEKNKKLASSNINIYSHAKIPKKALFDFTVKPEYNETESSKLQAISKSKFHFGEKKKSGRRKAE